MVKMQEGAHMKKLFNHNNVLWSIRILCALCLIFGGVLVVLVSLGISLPKKTGTVFLMLTSLLFFVAAMDKNLFMVEKMFYVAVGLSLLCVLFGVGGV